MLYIKRRLKFVQVYNYIIKYSDRVTRTGFIFKNTVKNTLDNFCYKPPQYTRVTRLLYDYCTDLSKFVF